MEIKNFNGKTIQVNGLSKKHLNKIKEFRDFINSLVKEDAQIKVNKKQTMEQERQWLEKNIKRVIEKKAVVLAAEHNGRIVGNAGIDLAGGRHSHIGVIWAAVRQGYRGIGLGTYLLNEIIALAKKELKPQLKIIKIVVYPTNQKAIKLYQRLGFKKAAEIPRQTFYKGKLISEIIMLLDL